MMLRKIVIVLCGVLFCFNVYAKPIITAPPPVKPPFFPTLPPPVLQTSNYNCCWKDFLSKTQLDGNIRAYYFIRDFGKAGVKNQRAFSLGGKLNLLTAPFWRAFRVGGTIYTAQPLGLNHSVASGRVDRTLPGTALTAVGQAFIQYYDPAIFVRVGDQLIDTPWVNPADTRMIPATYQGVNVILDPVSDWNFIFMRLNRYKSRVWDSFTRSNLYDDPNNLGATIPALKNTHAIGTLAVGTRYKCKSLYLQGWGYQFYNYSDLLYADARYTLENETIFKPIFGVQYMHQWHDGKNLINSVAHLGSVDNGQGYGFLIGSEIGKGKLLFGYNHILKKAGHYLNGDIVSPYTAGYNSDPLYTTSMIAGLIEKAAGTAYKVAATYSLYDDNLRLGASYAKYYTSSFLRDTDEGDADITYFPTQLCKSLSLRYRYGVLNGQVSTGRFVYHRLQLEYNFA